MAKYDYSAMTDEDNRFPKHVPTETAVTAETVMNQSNVPFTSKTDADDCKEFWKDSHLVGVFGISKKMLYYARTGNLDQFIP